MGLSSVLPLIPEIIPFGAVMESALSEANLDFWQAMLMNTTVNAAGTQLATVRLMKLKAAVIVVVATGFIINMGFLLSSAPMSPYLMDFNPWTKFLCAFTLTDLSYSAMSGNQHRFSTNKDATNFYLGTAACKMISWQSSVVAWFLIHRRKI